MNYKFKIIYILAFVLVFSSCDNNFEEINSDPDNVSTPSTALVFADVLKRTTNDRFEAWRSNFIYTASLSQSVTQWWWAGHHYYINDQWAGAYYERMYKNYGKNVINLIDLLQESPEEVNTLSAARIWKVYLFQRVTDMHGDVPYFGAGKGFSEQIFFPEFDSQEDIYLDFIKELKEAVAALDANQQGVLGDHFFGGDIDKWRKFGNSLLLRTAMRLSKVNATLAETEVGNAFTGGVMDSNDDNVIMLHDSNTANGNAQVVQADNFYITEPMAMRLRNTNDPRLPIYADNTDGSGTYPGVVPGQTVDATASHINALFADPNTPHVHMGFYEVSLLLAEAAARGWITGDPATHYANGVRAHMESLAILPGNPTISSTDIDAFLLANPYDNSSLNASLEQINTQLWIGHFYHNGYESFANWRRSGYPVLAQAVSAVGANETDEFPRRIPYPNNESTFNTENFQKVLAAIGGENNFDGRVWWDVE